MYTRVGSRVRVFMMGNNFSSEGNTVTFKKFEFSSLIIGRKFRASIEIIGLYKHKRSLVTSHWI